MHIYIFTLHSHSCKIYPPSWFLVLAFPLVATKATALQPDYQQAFLDSFLHRASWLPSVLPRLLLKQ